MRPFIAPSVLAADFANLQRDVEMINESEASFIHVDVMDGVFVPNISMGMPIVEAIHRYAKKPLDVHLMIVDPDRYLVRFKDCGAAHITVHYEACNHLHRTLAEIKRLECKAGVALNPHTPVEFLTDIIQDVDLVCIMSVNPGFGGQKFIEHSYKKIERLKKLIVETGSSTQIEVDGGVSLENAPLLLQSGADILVAGNFIFTSKNPIETVNKLKNIA
ncbi:Ribulose-phosphate 3-epimerase [Lunatimonas lonarensis]|uniref:Ribulose-phosphate 3-epimerase n=1 Tax=Lunatimonas lonarensis TaxID=1232681 RepID=R7ZRN8_9BACT|nr:ribulose-phosphate 3-epimerase [Lunatimonas lonarensis]EON76713.1 Ribulose-phosphate 3-epimerase [Lunatimonas lonarensis]